MSARSGQDADVASRIASGAERAGAIISEDALSRLSAYIGLLTKWNRRLNLTALPLDPPGDETIDRLVVEPVIASGHVRKSDESAIDVGTGGGSPAIPLKIMAPWLEMLLVESRARKASFLREVVRELGLRGVVVEARRFEEIATLPSQSRADFVSLRGVRADAAMWEHIWSVLAPGGRVFWFGGLATTPARAGGGGPEGSSNPATREGRSVERGGDVGPLSRDVMEAASKVPPGAAVETHPLIAHRGSQLIIVTKRN